MPSMTLQVKTDPRVTDVVARLQNAGYETYIVGGAVRDFLLDRTPKDYDISTSATPEQVKAVFRDRRTLIIGRRFRLVHLYLGADILEISTFRKCPSRSAQANRPPRVADAPDAMILNDNEFGTADDDAHRRDFTVNALFYDPVTDRIADFTGMGMKDLKAGIIRSIGDPELRFEEDPVRILRALKLIGQYGFRLEEQTEAALRKTMPLVLHASVSRLTLELEKILKNSHGDAIFESFRRYGFLRYFLPQLDKGWDSPAGQYAMELFACRNRRMRTGLYRDSMSLAIALLTLPFAEEQNGNPPGGLWKLHDGIEPEFLQLMHRIFSPLILTRRSCSAAIRSLCAQTKLRAVRNEKNVRPSPVYPTARELALIQNEVQWHLPGFEELLPPPMKLGAPGKRRPHRRRRHRPAGEKQAAPPQNGEPGHAE
ncbi:MAG: hypothetical protein J5944_04395 [Lentisphaeria bacterium]|nr:hypothetical protein [Lentisphaeria bacterium]